MRAREAKTAGRRGRDFIRGDPGTGERQRRARRNGGGGVQSSRFKERRGRGGPRTPSTVDALAVAAEARGQGAGGLLLAEAEAIAAERGRRTLALDALADNLGAIRLYERSGYAIVRSERLWPPLSTLFGFTRYQRVINGGHVSGSMAVVARE